MLRSRIGISTAPGKDERSIDAVRIFAGSHRLRRAISMSQAQRYGQRASASSSGRREQAQRNKTIVSKIGKFGKGDIA